MMLIRLFRRINRHRDGSTLILVLIVFTVLMLLGMAALMASTVSTNITASTAAKQQADFIAQSAAKSAVSYIEQNNIQLSSGTLGGSVNFTDKGVASKIQVKFINSSAISVTATYTNNKGVSSKAVAYLTKSGAVVAPSGDMANPYNYLMYLSNGTSAVLNDQNNGSLASCTDLTISGGYTTGKLLVNGKLTVNNSGITLGQVVAMGDITFNGGTINGDVVSNGAITINNSGVNNNGSIYAKGNISLSGVTVQGNVSTDGTLTISNSGGEIKGNVYATGDIAIYGSTIDGGVYTNGNLYISGGEIKGEIVANQGISLTGGAIDSNASTPGSLSVSNGEIKGNALSNGGITITNSGKIDGNANTAGSLSMPAGSIGLNALANGNVYMSNASIGRNLTSGGTVTFDSWSPSVQGGTLILTGAGKYSIINSTATLSHFSINNVQVVSSVTSPLASSNDAAHSPGSISASFTPSTLNVVPAPTQTANSGLYQPVSIVNSVISADGTLVGNTDSSQDFVPSSQPWHTIITIDASAKDIYLRINKDIKLDNCTAFKVIGTHYVFFYLTDNCTLVKLPNSDYIGPQDTTKPTNVYFFGNKQEIDITSGSSIYGYLFIPGGDFVADNSSRYNDNGISCSYVLSGNVISNTASNEAWSVAMQYITPDYTLPQLASAVSGGSVSITGAGSNNTGGSGSGTWSLSGWSQ